MNWHRLFNVEKTVPETVFCFHEHSVQSGGRLHRSDVLRFLSRFSSSPCGGRHQQSEIFKGWCTYPATFHLLKLRWKHHPRGRLRNKETYGGGPVGLQSSQHRSRSAEMAEEGRQRVTSIAPGLLGIVDGTGYAGACLKEMGSRPFTQSVKKSNHETLRRLIPLRSLRTKREVIMEDLTPPDHHGPPNHRRAPRKSR